MAAYVSAPYTETAQSRREAHQECYYHKYVQCIHWNNEMKDINLELKYIGTNQYNKPADNQAILVETKQPLQK